MLDRPIVVSLAFVLLGGCGLETVLQREVTATVDNSSEIGAVACPLLVTTSDGQHLEVTVPDGYHVQVHRGPTAGPGVTGPGGFAAETGDPIRITLTHRQPAPSPCRWGMPVEASRISQP